MKPIAKMIAAAGTLGSYDPSELKEISTGGTGALRKAARRAQWSMREKPGLIDRVRTASSIVAIEIAVSQAEKLHEANKMAPKTWRRLLKFAEQRLEELQSRPVPEGYDQTSSAEEGCDA